MAQEEKKTFADWIREEALMTKEEYEKRKIELQKLAWQPGELVTDEGWLRLYQAFNTGNYMYGDNQLVKDIDDDSIAIGFFDKFAQKYSKPARFAVVVSLDSAASLAQEIMSHIDKRAQAEKGEKKDKK